MAKKMMVRVDDRLIHGQVLTQWVSTINAEKIVVIDDEISQDTMRKNVLKFAAPAELKISILSAERAVEIWNKNKFGNYNVFVLFRDVKMIRKCKDLGLTFPEISLGQMAVTGDRVAVYRSLGLTEEEGKILCDLEKEGVNLYFQMTPTDKKENLDCVKKTFLAVVS